MGIGMKIKELSDLKNINLKDLSKKADVSYNTLYAIVKRDNDTVKPEILVKIATALDTPLWHFMNIDFKDTANLILSYNYLDPKMLNDPRIKTAKPPKRNTEPFNIEIHLQEEGFSNEEINNIKNYIDFVKSKRPEDFKEMGKAISQNNNDNIK